MFYKGQQHRRINCDGWNYNNKKKTVFFCCCFCIDFRIKWILAEPHNSVHDPRIAQKQQSPMYFIKFKIETNNHKNIEWKEKSNDILDKAPTTESRPNILREQKKQKRKENKNWFLFNFFLSRRCNAHVFACECKIIIAMQQQRQQQHMSINKTTAP